MPKLLSVLTLALALSTSFAFADLAQATDYNQMYAQGYGQGYAGPQGNQPSYGPTQGYVPQQPGGYSQQGRVPQAQQPGYGAPQGYAPQQPAGYSPNKPQAAHQFGNSVPGYQDFNLMHKGNAKSKIVHNSRCKDFKSKGVCVPFTSKEEAMRQGFRPCKKCGG